MNNDQMNNDQLQEDLTEVLRWEEILLKLVDMTELAILQK